MPHLRAILSLLILAAACPHAWPAEPDNQGSPADVDFFEREIRPVLVQHCYECHSRDAKELGGNLLLDSRSEMLKGGDSGTAVVAGKPNESLLISALEYTELEMPPEAKLPEDVIRDFRRWIQLGAVDPRVATSGNETPIPEPPTEEHDLWSLQPVQPFSPPNVRAASWPRSDIDHFIWAKLDAQDLQPVTDATPGVLLRRLYFDLVGIPPGPAELKDFEDNPSFQRLVDTVDQLLASPQFGERWARHWFDVVRYAESAGNSRDVLMPHAWRYRDYVIDAINNDVPFDRFVTEQIAGDLLDADSSDRQRLRVATGLLAVGSKSLNGGNITWDLIDDQIDAISKAVMGLTVSCARCHDHKFDPIPTRDYYALAGIFKSTDTRYGGGTKRPKSIQEQLDVYLSLGADDQAMAQRADEHVQHKLQKESPPALKFAVGVREAKTISNAAIHVRGEKNKLGEVVPRGFLSCISIQNAPRIGNESSGRLELAQWLTSPDHPLTPRVAVNRIWQHLFGRGLVETVDNFGRNGAQPTHPELLDFLAHRFVVTHGWSVKKLIRELVVSRTYGLSHEFREDAHAIDPGNKLLWRHPRRRLEAEALRDAMLVASGRMHFERPIASPVTRIGEGEVGRNINTQPLDESYPYRSVYLPILRTRIPEFLKLFDLPEPSNPQGQRDTTNVPAQALYFLNSGFVLEHAEGLARRAVAMDDDIEERIRFLFRVTLARYPTKQELHDARQLIESHVERWKENKTGRELAAWASVSQALFASADFRYVE